MKRLSLPQLIWLSGLIAMVGTHFLIPLRMIIPKEYTFIGYVLLVAGVYYMLQAHKTIRNKAMLTYMKAPDVLLTTGPFRYSRNPLYLG
jgi:protein-S-isoprenylcysteine O-methyltransferase Ste14